MTEQQIQYYKGLKQEEAALLERRKVVVTALQRDERELDEKFRAFYDQCDHTYPDGTPSIEHSFTCSFCTICDWNDL
jgi:predicted mannosyl-3-phosphoglycerate phosphatase (HAD superfamily)